MAAQKKDEMNRNSQPTPMRRTILRPAVFACFVLLAASAQAQFNYVTNSGTITITGYTGSGGNVTIPSTTNGLAVTGIGTNAFYECWLLTSVTIPDGVTSIGAFAFAYCGLTNVTIPNSVTNIGDDAFSVCGMTSVTIPDSVTTLGDSVFLDCCTLTSATIGNGVAGIGYEAFFLCSNLRSMTIGNSVGSIGSNAFSGCSLTHVTIPNSVTNIETAAFQNCSGLTNLTIGSGVANIGNNAFYGCCNLRSVTIPDRVTNIESEAFYQCTNLAAVTLGSNVVSIGDYAFYGCVQLKSAAIPDSATSIEEAAFDGCTNLAAVTLGSGLTSLGVWAFSGGIMTSVTIPDSLTNIGSKAFWYCPLLSSITVGAQNPAYASVGGVLFNRSMTTLVQYPPGNRAGAYALPNSVTSIGSLAFYGCASLTNVTLGSGVTNIGDMAFFECTNLTQAFFQGNATSAESDLFYGAPGTVYYLPGTTGWTNTFGGLPTAPWYQRNPQVLGNGCGLGVQSNRFNFIVSWATNASVVVQACTNLARPVWTPVATNTLAGGTTAFSDPQWTNYPSRFYRVRSQ